MKPLEFIGIIQIPILILARACGVINKGGNVEMIKPFHNQLKFVLYSQIRGIFYYFIIIVCISLLSMCISSFMFSYLGGRKSLLGLVTANTYPTKCFLKEGIYGRSFKSSFRFIIIGELTLIKLFTSIH